MMVLIPAVLVAVSCYTVGVALTEVIEVIVFVARVADPRPRLKLEGRGRRRWPLRRRAVRLAPESPTPE
jgi:hypothetical protein